MPNVTDIPQHTLEYEFNLLLKIPSNVDEKNLDLLRDWFLWRINDPEKRTIQALADRHNKISRSRPRQIIKSFRGTVQRANRGKSAQVGVAGIISLIVKMTECQDSFIPHDEFTKMLVREGVTNAPILFQCIIDLAAIFKCPIALRVVTYRDQKYIVPKSLLEQTLEKICSNAHRLSRHYGGMYPYDSFLKSPFCQGIPQHFIQTLLSAEGGYLQLDDESVSFFAFRSDGVRLETQLRKIFSVYNEVPTEKLVDAMYWKIKRRFQAQKRGSVTVLKRCSQVYDEYCLKVGFISTGTSDEMRVRNQSLKEIDQKKLSNRLFNVEVKAVAALRANGKAMITKEFIDFIDSEGLTDYKTYLTDHPILFYRTGTHGNSSYHTLDGKYSETDLEAVVKKDLDSLRAEQSVLFPEGGMIKRLVSVAERNPQLRVKAIKIHGTRCKACGFEFGEMYGERGYSYIEVHHKVPLSSRTELANVDAEKDMTVLCSNCHRMIHRKKDQVLSVEELRALINARRTKTAGLP